MANCLCLIQYRFPAKDIIRFAAVQAQLAGLVGLFYGTVNAVAFPPFANGQFNKPGNAHPGSFQRTEIPGIGPGAFVLGR